MVIHADCPNYIQTYPDSLGHKHTITAIVAVRLKFRKIHHCVGLKFIPVGVADLANALSIINSSEIPVVLKETGTQIYQIK